MTRSRVLFIYFFSMSHFTALPFGLREYLCDSSYSGVARAKCTGLASPLHTSTNTAAALITARGLDVKMICRRVLISISCGPAETVNYERRQAALNVNPYKVKVRRVRNTFSGLKVLGKQTAPPPLPPLGKDRVIALD